MLLCLSKTPDGPNKELTVNSEAGARIGGAARERGSAKENKERKMSGACHLATQQATEKEVKRRIQKLKKGKSPEAKGSWDNLKLSKSWQETSQAKGRHSHLRISLHV